MITMNMF